MIKSCDTCKYCKPNKTFLSFWGLQHSTAMEFAKCLANPKGVKFSKAVPQEYYFCSTAFDSNFSMCKYEAK